MKLAYYAAESGPGVLAPRGWHCFGLYGSNGSILIVTPEQHRSSEFFGEKLFATAGPAVVLQYSYGGTSGRWAVAQGIARYFPQQRSFIRDNFEGLEVGPLPSGPHPHDLILSRTERLVRLTTPPGQLGEGTSGFLSPGMQPVQSIVTLLSQQNGPDLLKVNVRFGSADSALASIILRRASAGEVR